MAQSTNGTPKAPPKRGVNQKSKPNSRGKGKGKQDVGSEEEEEDEYSIYDDVDTLLENQKSPLFEHKLNLAKILSHPLAKTILSTDTNQSHGLISALAAIGNDDESFKRASIDFKNFGKEGMYDREWLAQGLVAAEERTEGKFDEYLEKKCMRDWVDSYSSDEQYSADEDEVDEIVLDDEVQGEECSAATTSATLQDPSFGGEVTSNGYEMAMNHDASRSSPIDAAPNVQEPMPIVTAASDGDELSMDYEIQALPTPAAPPSTATPDLAFGDEASLDPSTSTASPMARTQRRVFEQTSRPSLPSLLSRTMLAAPNVTTQSSSTTTPLEPPMPPNIATLEALTPIKHRRKRRGIGDGPSCEGEQADGSEDELASSPSQEHK